MVIIQGNQRKEYLILSPLDKNIASHWIFILLADQITVMENKMRV